MKRMKNFFKLPHFPRSHFHSLIVITSFWKTIQNSNQNPFVFLSWFSVMVKSLSLFFFTWLVSSNSSLLLSFVLLIRAWKLSTQRTEQKWEATKLEIFKKILKYLCSSIVSCANVTSIHRYSLRWLNWPTERRHQKQMRRFVETWISWENYFWFYLSANCSHFKSLSTIWFFLFFYDSISFSFISIDYRTWNESSWYGCGFIEIIRKDNEGRVDDIWSSNNIFTFFCISTMQL